MTRRAYPYTPFDNQVQPVGVTRTTLPMDAPTLEYRNHYRPGTRIGEEGNTRGSLALVVPVQTPHDTTAGGPGPTKPTQGIVQGTTDGTVSSRTVTGGVVRGYITDNDSIRIHALVSRNLMSPTSHPRDATRLAMSGKTPPKNTVPSKDIGMPPKMGKRGTGGNFTIPNPMVLPTWPTSAQWLHNRFG